MKKYIITDAAEAMETGKNADKLLQMFEIDGPDAMQVGDGYHTMDELYDHRLTLFIALARVYSNPDDMYLPGQNQEGFVWRSKRHSDGLLCFGTGTQFVLGIGRKAGEQITYHIPLERWEETDFAKTLYQAPEFDGHTSQDVLERLKKL